ncbi:MAG TPA: polysaccharide deacetylase family protein [Methylomirabilota bacterium]|nr:polysaccharide deacetylase family protein [Methylomirabilota bacterium]
MKPRPCHPVAFLINFVLSVAALGGAAERRPVPDKLVVLTFDDACASHYSVARPLLKRFGFGATFFITEGFSFRTNKKDYMTWEQIAELHRDGFEIGNHTRDHLGVNAHTAGRLPGQLDAIASRCREHGIPAPVSFAWPGNVFHTNALPLLRAAGIRFARRGGEPEVPYQEGGGVAYEPGVDHPLLIPTTGDARPDWTLENLQRAVAQARDGKIAVLQFHGVPDGEHPWVNTPRERFEEYMAWLHQEGFKVIALRDLAAYVDETQSPADPLRIMEERRQARAAARASGGAAPTDPRAPSVVRFDPVVRDLDGWKVHIEPALLEGPLAEEGGRALAMLANHLQRIKILVPAGPLSRLQAVEIWIEHDHPRLRPMQYHPSRDWLIRHGHDPRLARKVHIPQARELLSREQMLKHPAVILHELAHAYHDQVLGFDHPDILRVFQAARAAGSYEQVLLYTGAKVRHYALTDHKEYFAEGTEAYFYRNDFYPFVRAELKEHDPELHDLLGRIWETTP